MSSSFDFNLVGPQDGSASAATAGLHPNSINDGNEANYSNMPSPQSPPRQDASAGSSHTSRNVTVYQTTGPDAHTTPILTPGTGTPALNPRSCVTCRRRKVRCDKQMPCSNCRRAQIPCIFPAPGRAPRQQRPKDPNAPPKNSSQREVELVKRLRKLEGIVEELSGQLEVESGNKGPSAAGSPSANGTDSIPRALHRSTSAGAENSAASPSSSQGKHSDMMDNKELQKHFGRLVLDDTKGSARYVSSAFWSKLNDELDFLHEETQKLTDDDEESDYEGTPTESPTSMQSTGDHHSFIFGYRSSDVNLQKCHPSQAHATYMWSVYLENVEPMLKLIHVPTMDPIMREARRSPEKLTPAQETLVFSIYLASIVSLEPNDVAANFGAHKDDLINQYRFAVEQALSKANFLDTSELMVLQAFTIFLTVIRRHDASRFCWALTSLVIKIAQGMGIHRDGTHFGLSPFETEMRRRVWWSLLGLDLRAAEDLGTDMTVGERSYDTEMPLNINDTDISPASTELPESREGRSDSAISVVRYEMTGLCRRIVNASSEVLSSEPKAGEGSVDDREEMLIEVYQRLEQKFIQHVFDETDPLYWVAAMICRIIMAKMCLVIYQPMLFPGNGVQQPSNELRQRIFIAAIEIAEYNYKVNTDPRCKQYSWLFQTYTNWHAIAYTLVESCRRPWTAVVERGWEAVQNYERDPLGVSKHVDMTEVFLPLRRLFAKARKHREAEVARLKGNQEEARRLDFAERMSPAQAQFGVVPGAEHRMSEVREKWRALVRPEGASPMPFSTRTHTPIPPDHQQNPGPPIQNHGEFLSVQQVAVPNASPVPSVPIDFGANPSMQYMEGFINQPPAPMPGFWQMDGVGTNPELGNIVVPDLSGSMDGQMLQQQALQQQALKLQTELPKEGHAPPYMWSDPFTVMNTKFDDQIPEDTDMLGENFDWQDWSQSIRGLEMESTQPHKW